MNVSMGTKRKILVLDDDQTVCDTISRTLKNRGYEVFTATHYQDGVEKAGEVLPDLVYLGLLLDTTNGLKVSREIHALEKLKNVPVVMIISYKGELDPRHTLTIGIVDVLVKPLKESDIISKTEAILGIDVIPNAGEEANPEISVIENIGEALEPEEEYVLDRTDATDGEVIRLEEYHDDIPGMIDDEMSQTQERIHGTGDVLSGREEISEELLSESGFDRRGDGNAEQRDEEENYLESMHDEDQARPEDVEIHEEAGVNPFDEAEKPGSRKKILTGAVTLVLISVIGLGTYLGMQFFWGGRDRSVLPSPVQETPVKDKAEARKTGVDDKAKKPAAVASEENIKKEEVLSRTNAAEEREKGPAPQNSLTAKETKVQGGQDKEVFSVQIGFFGSLKNAESLAEKMKQKGYAVFLKKEEKGAGKMSYRVMVGKFSSRKEAAEQATDILRKEGMNAIPYKE